MAGVMSNLSSVFLPRQLGNSRRYFFKSSASRVLEKRIFVAQVRASSSSSTAIVETKSPADPVVVEKEVSTNNILACPICYDSLTWVGNPGLSVESAAGSTLQCSTCKKSYIGNETHLDLTAASKAKKYDEPMPLSTELFRLPLISFLYERGWRQSFSVLGGFPGPEKEFELMRDFLKPVLGGNIVDASCGSGLFSRLFAKSGLFSLVVALDYSENMLQQCYEFIKQEGNFPKENLILVRADISRLPFVSSSVDAVHAGAALHCWPSPSAATEGGSWPPYKSERLPLVTDLGEHVYKHLLVAEISRVLRPGGVFVATTFILDGPYSFLPFFRTVCQNTTLISGNHFFVSERELEDLCRACGLVGFTCIRNRRFVMISASKPI